MIITVTLNPAVDRTVKIPGFTIDKVNRVVESRDDAAGKGINVSKVIKELGYESVATGIVAGNTGEYISNYLNNIDIENDFFRIAGETRVNMKVVDEKNRTHTDINELGPDVSEEDQVDIKRKILKYASEDNIIVISGSIPRGISKEIYKDLIMEINKKGARVILDADGELFLSAVESAPYMVKPNIHELEEALDMRVDDKKSLIAAAEKILDKGVQVVAVSLGKDGSMYISREEIFWAKGMEVDVKSTVGAGDSMVAALAISLEKNMSGDEAIKLAAAVSTANVMTEGTQTGKMEDIDVLLKEVDVQEIEC